LEDWETRKTREKMERESGWSERESVLSLVLSGPELFFIFRVLP